MGRVLVTAPAELPVSLAEAKLAVTEEGTAWDSAFNDIWIPAATSQAEGRTGRALVTQTWKLTLEAFPCGAVALPYPPLQSVSSIKYLDPDGALQTLADSEYQVVNDELIGFVQPAYGKSWPSTRTYPGAIQIEFIAGFGAAADVPRDIKNWILMAVSTWYRQREGLVTGTIVNDLPRDFFAALLDRHVIPSI